MFPDTYRLYEDASPRDLAERLLQTSSENFLKVCKILRESRVDQSMRSSRLQVSSSGRYEMMRIVHWFRTSLFGDLRRECHYR